MLYLFINRWRFACTYKINKLRHIGFYKVPFFVTFGEYSIQKRKKNFMESNANIIYIKITISTQLIL